MSDADLIIYPRAPLGRMLVGLGWLVIGLATLLLLALGRIDLAILAGWAIWFLLLGVVLLGALLIRIGRWHRSKPILSADALGLCAGFWGRRQPWRRLDRITLRETLTCVDGVHDMLVISPRMDLIPGTHSMVGRLVARGLYEKSLACGAMRGDVRDIVAGLDRAARAGGYRLTAAEGPDSKVWIIEELADLD